MSARVVLVFFAIAICKGDDRVPSPDGRRFANVASCSQADPCIPEVAISTQDGREIRRFQVQAGDEPCASIEGLEWASDITVGVICHANPSLSYYYEVDIASGKVLRVQMQL